MVTMTSSAAEQMKSFVQVSGIPGGAVRLFVTGGGCCGPGFALDVVSEKADTDVTIAQDGATLYVQKEAAEFLQDVVIDFRNNFMFRGLRSSGCCG